MAPKDRVEGEGSYSGSKDYNQRTEKFVESGKVDRPIERQPHAQSLVILRRHEVQRRRRRRRTPDAHQVRAALAKDDRSCEEHGNPRMRDEG